MNTDDVRIFYTLLRGLVEYFSISIKISDGSGLHPTSSPFESLSQLSSSRSANLHPSIVSFSRRMNSVVPATYREVTHFYDAELDSDDGLASDQEWESEIEVSFPFLPSPFPFLSKLSNIPIVNLILSYLLTGTYLHHLPEPKH